MKVVFASIAAYGHLYPMMPLALACAEAGHQVIIATGEPFLDRLPLHTMTGQPSELGIDDAIGEARRRHPEATGLDLSVAMFADVTAEHVNACLLPAFEADRPDLVVYEGLNVGAGLVADLLSIPAVAFSIGLAAFVPSIVHRAAVGFHSDQWLRRGLEPPAGALLASALVDPAPPSLQGVSPGPRHSDPSIRLLPIRSVAYNESVGELPASLMSPRTRPRVYLTLGTVSFGALEVLRRAVSEISELDVDLLVAVGPEGDPAALGEVGSNVHVERFVAQSQVLPLVDLVVHHGGTGTVLGTLAEGLPQLVMPQGADQFFNAEVLTHIGAARALTNDQQGTGAIQAAVSAMLTDDAERRVALRLGDEIAALPAPGEVVSELVRLAERAPQRGVSSG